jgi:RNA polymerase sigma-54 factor
MVLKNGVPNQVLALRKEQKQNVQLTQRLIMSAHMQQAIKLLQLPLLELEPFIEEQIVVNPLLEIIDSEEKIDLNEPEEKDEKDSTLEQEIIINDQDFTILRQLEEEYQDYFSQHENPPIKKSNQEKKYQNYLENSIYRPISLYEFLIQQARDSFENPEELVLAQILIGYIDGIGFLTTPLEEIALLHGFSLEKLKNILKEIKTFEPYGIGASTIQESLLIQLRCLKKENTLAYLIVECHYEELLHNRIPLIQKGLHRSSREIEESIEKDIAKLDLHPGNHFSSQQAQILVPDVNLRQEGDQLVVDVNQEYAPHLRLNQRYLKLLDDPQVPFETKNFIRKYIFSAKWLMRNLQQRYSTVERIAHSLAHRQYEFFTQSDGKLVPLTMKTIAEELQVHESTVARTVSNKYINSPRGLMPLRDFFTTGYVSEQGQDLSSKTVCDTIVEIIESENKRHPLSDEKICGLLKAKGIPCARRTIAKYRAVLRIGNAQQRKKF